MEYSQLEELHAANLEGVPRALDKALQKQLKLPVEPNPIRFVVYSGSHSLKDVASDSRYRTISVLLNRVFSGGERHFSNATLREIKMALDQNILIPKFWEKSYQEISPVISECISLARRTGIVVLHPRTFRLQEIIRNKRIGVVDLYTGDPIDSCGSLEFAQVPYKLVFFSAYGIEDTSIGSGLVGGGLDCCRAQSLKMFSDLQLWQKVQFLTVSEAMRLLADDSDVEYDFLIPYTNLSGRELADVLPWALFFFQLYALAGIVHIKHHLRDRWAREEDFILAYNSIPGNVCIGFITVVLPVVAVYSYFGVSGFGIWIQLLMGGVAGGLGIAIFSLGIALFGKMPPRD